MTKNKISIICLICLMAIIMVFSSAVFADETAVLDTSLKQLTLNEIDISNLHEFFNSEYVEQYSNQEVRLIVKYSKVVDSLKEDLQKENVEIVVHNTFSSSFLGQAITIKVQDILKLSKLSYVKSVTVSNKYYSLANYSSISNTTKGIFNNSSTYKGEGLLACVIDNAFDTSHNALSNFESSPSNLKLTTQVISDTLYDLNAYKLSSASAQELYVSDKIAFAYDYAQMDTTLYTNNQDHGTHVAGIIAGCNSSFKGVMPDAQLALMKVGDEDGSMYTDTILKALEDAKKLDVDVINMSLGSASGFSYNEDDILTKALDELNDLGVIVVCAAGNSYTSSYGAQRGDLALSKNIDNGTIASPASYKTTLSIANAAEENYVVINSKDSVAHKLVLSNGYYLKTNTYGNYFEKYLSYISEKSIPENKLPYVLLEKDNELLLGKDEDYSNIDVDGKIVIVKRGEITFVEKIEHAKKHNAIGVIVVNTTQADVIAQIDTTSDIPFALAKQSALEIFKEGDGYIHFEDTNRTLIVNNSSSQGVLNDLSMGIDLTAFGTNIYSLGLDQSFVEMTGTSMASPNAAGAILAVEQYVKDENGLNITNKNDAKKTAQQILMSTTTLLRDLNNNLYSPRVQGAGLINLENALNKNAYIYVEGIDKTKIELKDNLSKTFTLSFSVVNTSSEERIFTPEIKLLTEIITKDNELSGYCEELSIKNTSFEQITVYPKSTATVQLQVTLSDESIEKLQDKTRYPSGAYVDGFVILKEDGSHALSCPIIAYYGDFDAIKMLDITAYDETEEIKADMLASTSYGVYAGAYYMPMGKFAYVVDEDQEELVSKADEKYASLSIYSSTMYSLGLIQLGLLRNAEYITCSVVDTLTGEVVYKSDASYVTKLAYLSGYGMYGGMLFEEISPYALNLENNRNYQVIVNVYRLYDENEENTVSDTYTQNFSVDIEAPVISNISYTQDKQYVDLTIRDNNYVQAILVCTGKGTTATNVSLQVEKVHPINIEKNKEETIRLEIKDAIKNATNGYIYYYIVDYAFNYAIYYDNTPLTNTIIGSNSSRPTGGTSITTTSLKFNVSSQEIKVNEVKSLATKEILTGFDLEKKYTWSVTDNEIANISQEGEIVGIKEGITTIEVVDENNNKASLVIKVEGRVDSNINFTSVKISSYKVTSTIDEKLLFNLDLDKNELKFAPNEGIAFFVSFEPFNYNYVENKVKVKLESNNQDIISTKDNTIFAKSSGDAVVRVSITYNEGSEQLIKEYNVKVVPATYVNEDGVLQACFIQEEEIDFSLGEYQAQFVAIATNAFKYAKNVKNIVLPEECLVIYKDAFKDCTSLVSINLKNVKSIYDGAFSGCVCLDNIDLSNIELLSDDAFIDCVNLRFVSFKENQLQKASISMKAFNNCSRLSYFKEGANVTKTLISNNKLLFTLDLADALDTEKSFNIIGANSFSALNISEIDLSSKEILRIENGAFKNNKKLTKITLNNVEYIGSDAFSGCDNLKVFNLASNKATPSLHIASRAFSYCGIETIDFSGFNTTYEDMAFLGCAKLKYINMGAVQEIGKYTFALCQDLCFAEFEEGSKKIGENTFALAVVGNTYYYHDNLREVIVPSSIESIDEYAFAFCRNLDFTNINLSNVKVINEGAFYGTNINKKIILTNVTKIGNSAFAESNIGEISINENSTSNIEIGELAFYKCDSLQTVRLPKNENATVSILKGAFYECVNLSSDNKTISFLNPLGGTYYGINLERVVNIGDYAFCGCSALSNVKIPSCTSVGYAAFGNCEKLKYLEGNSLENISDFAFYNSNLSTFIIPLSIKYIGKSVFNDNEDLQIRVYDSGYENIVIDLTSDSLPIIYNKLSNGSLSLVYYPYQSKDETYKVLDNTSIIETYAFYNAANLENIIINNVDLIGHGAFYKSNLKSVIIHDKLPVLSSTYNDNSVNMYCNFKEEMTTVDGLILIINESLLDQAKIDYIYANYFDYILTSENDMNAATLADLINKLKDVNVENLTKSEIEGIILKYNNLNDKEKALLENEDLTTIKEKMTKIEAINNAQNNSSSSNNDKKGTSLSEGLDSTKGFFNLPAGVIIAIVVAIAIIVLAVITVITWYIASLNLRRKNRDDHN